MAVLILAPILKVLKERVELVVWVALQMPVDADVPPVADLRPEHQRLLVWYHAHIPVAHTGQLLSDNLAGQDVLQGLSACPPRYKSVLNTTSCDMADMQYQACGPDNIGGSQQKSYNKS